ncbi:MAG: zinc ribbon domain-containing protein [Clostridia bacterium]|nr:zinc ribbon domain-containing protein [Clostridia bacterium]
MKCTRCQTDNLQIARYCSTCGQPFSDAEREAAYAQTPFGKLDKARKIKSILTLDVITGSIWYKILILLLIIALGIFLRLNGVSAFRVEKSDGYNLQYAAKTASYYVITEDTKADLRLVVPRGTVTLRVDAVDKMNNTVSTGTFPAEAGISLPVSGTLHYQIYAENKTRATDKLTLYVYRGAPQEVSDAK